MNLAEQAVYNFEETKNLAEQAVYNFEETKIKAEQGTPYDQFRLGFMYERGDGVKQDYTKALEWYRKVPDTPTYCYVKCRISKVSEKLLEEKNREFNKALHEVECISYTLEKAQADKAILEVKCLTSTLAKAKEQLDVLFQQKRLAREFYLEAYKQSPPRRVK